MFETLFEADGLPRFDLPTEVTRNYGPLGLPDEVVYANFVSSIDGVVAFEREVTQPAGRLLSGGAPADRFLMGLLRACADAIVVGAGTARDEVGHVWTPERADRGSAEIYSDVRRRLGLGELPEVFIVTASGRLDGDLAGVRAATVIRGEGGRLDLAAVISDLRAQGYRRILTEGGPRLLGGMLRAGLVDELFLTLAPVVAGRDGAGRPGFVEGARLLPETHVDGRLLSLRRTQEGMLFLRYALSG